MVNYQALDSILKSLNLLAIRDTYKKVEQQIQKTKLGFVDYLYELVQIEIQAKHEKHISGLLKTAKLPRNKLLDDFDISRIPKLHPGVIKNLSEGSFIDKAENILIFGNPGTGKTHLAISLCREWCLQGKKCIYISAANLVQQLVEAKNSFKLNNVLQRFDKFEVLVIDDISYIPYDKIEADLLFILLAQRYEQRSTVITSNLVFSKWHQIFKDEMQAAAAIDRLVHHATILELNAESFRAAAAQTKLMAINNNHIDNNKQEVRTMIA
jgi:DNA replication protein DnaC